MPPLRGSDSKQRASSYNHATPSGFCSASPMQGKSIAAGFSPPNAMWIIKASPEGAKPPRNINSGGLQPAERDVDHQGKPRRGDRIVESGSTPRKQAPKGRNHREDAPIEIAAHRGADHATPSGFRFQPTRVFLQSCHPFGVLPGIPSARKINSGGLQPAERDMDHQGKPRRGETAAEHQ